MQNGILNQPDLMQSERVTYSPFSWSLPSCMLFQNSESNKNHEIIMWPGWQVATGFIMRVRPNHSLMKLWIQINMSYCCVKIILIAHPWAILKGWIKALTRRGPTGCYRWAGLIWRACNQSWKSHSVMLLPETSRSSKADRDCYLETIMLFELIMIVKSIWSLADKVEKLISGNWVWRQSKKTFSSN